LNNSPIDARQVNSSTWQNIYSEGKNDLRYPNDVLVRIGARLFGESRDRRILDFGFGAGANFVHFAGLGFQMHGVEISDAARVRTEKKLLASGHSGDLRLIQAGEQLPFVDSYFHVAYAWQVLYYNDRNGWTATVRELERVTKEGGLIVVATAAPGDVSHLGAEPLGKHMYRSRVVGQEGCILTIPDRRSLPRFFPGRHLEIGEFGFRFGDTATRHWIVYYRVEKI